MRIPFILAAAFAVSSATSTLAQEGEPTEQVSPAVEQLRHVIGTWDVATTFLRDDGTEAGTAPGVYTFEWVMEDKIVQGISAMPQFNMASGILFYVREATGEIEMVSVGPDGQLWTMTGPVDSEMRETPVVTNPDGSTIKLRFTRFNVTPDRFESKMERSSDGGQTWTLGNRQVFVRTSGQSDIAAEKGSSMNLQSAISATRVFAELRPLVGRWEGTNEEGNPVAIEYSLTANDTALVERWFFHNGMEALTIYHPDGDQMMATHYCPIGNQPRLDLMRKREDGTLEFEYASATNLSDIDDAHEHAFDLRIIDGDTIHRNETYMSDGQRESNGTTFKRTG